MLGFYPLDKLREKGGSANIKIHNKNDKNPSFFCVNYFRSKTSQKRLYRSCKRCSEYESDFESWPSRDQKNLL